MKGQKCNESVYTILAVQYLNFYFYWFTTKHTIFVECFTELNTWIILMIFINVKLLWGQQGFPLVESCDQGSRSPIDQRAIEMEIKFGKDIVTLHSPGGIILLIALYYVPLNVQQMAHPHEIHLLWKKKINKN